MVRASLGKNSLVADVKKSSDVLQAVEKKSSAYPCYALPIRSLLEMDSWRPHQDLLADGLLVNVDEKPDANVIFMSHQWTSFKHPDPKNEQLVALKTLLGNLLGGGMSVRTNPPLEMGYHYHRVTGPEEWRALLEDGYIWLDYISIPQPLAAKKNEAEEMGVEDVDEVCAHAGLITGAAAHAGMIAADHRHSTETDTVVAKLVEQLRAAVDSIPQYVERCIMMWVLVPPVAHADVSGAVCDFHSWRSRGWCRLEYAASNLARHDMPVLVVSDPNKPPEYFSPCDAMKVPAARGNFTVDEDRSKVLDVLQKMVDNKVAFYEEQDDYTLARFLRCFSPMITGGMGEKRPLAEGESAVGRLKLLLKWRDEATEAKWQAATGWNLLTCAALLDDTAAVRELLATPAAAPLLKAKGKKLKATQHYHAQPFAQLLFNMAHGHVPLMGCMGFGSPETCRAMLSGGLEAGVPVPQKDVLDIVCGTPCHRPTGALLNARTDNMDVFLEYYPGFDVNGVWASAAGQTPLHIACSMDAADGAQMRSLRWLLARGAAKSMNVRMDFGFTPLQTLCWAQGPQSLDALKLLREHGADAASANLHEKIGGKMATMKKVMATLRTVSATGSLPDAFIRFFEMFDVGGTALHRAAENGNVEQTKLLLEMGADIHARDAKGRTPYERCVAKLPAGSCQPQMLESLLATEPLRPAASATAKRSKWTAVSLPSVRKPPARVLPKTAASAVSAVVHSPVVMISGAE